MKTLEAKAFWVVFRVFFFFSERNFKEKEPNQRMKIRRTNTVGKLKVQKVKNKGAVSKMSFES